MKFAIRSDEINKFHLNQQIKIENFYSLDYDGVEENILPANKSLAVSGAGSYKPSAFKFGYFVARRIRSIVDDSRLSYWILSLILGKI